MYKNVANSVQAEKYKIYCIVLQVNLWLVVIVIDLGNRVCLVLMFDLICGSHININC